MDDIVELYTFHSPNIVRNDLIGDKIICISNMKQKVKRVG